MTALHILSGIQADICDVWEIEDPREQTQELRRRCLRWLDSIYLLPAELVVCDPRERSRQPAIAHDLPDDFDVRSTNVSPQSLVAETDSEEVTHPEITVDVCLDQTLDELGVA